MKNTRAQKKSRLTGGQTEPDLITFYNIRPGKGSALLFQSGAHDVPGCQSLHVAVLIITEENYRNLPKTTENLPTAP